jgi:predicted nucleic acid-binding protein
VKYIFVDTSAWDAIADRDDPHHDIAIAFKDEITTDCRLLVTNYILDELYTLLLMNLGYDGAVRSRLCPDGLSMPTMNVI